jgi:phosphatidylserine/phosphatidylglycerophosphate/cardiolipin synthase-like enzyme
VCRVQRPRTLGDILLPVDRAIGDGVARGVLSHHRRRLARIGWLEALDAPPGGWAAGDPPSRAGNELEVLIDGAEALPRIASELSSAQSHVYLAGWYVSPEFALTRDGRPTVLRNLLAELTRRVELRVLLWAGAPIPLFRPSRRDVRQVARELAAAGIRCGLDRRERPLHCHHEKTIVVDDRVAFVGGMDLTSQDGDRFDPSDHPARAQVGWHDVTTRLVGPAVADVSAHFRLRWGEVTGERLPPRDPPDAAGNVEVQIVRTVPEKVYEACPRGDFRILESYVRALRSAERLIYLENQFLWSPEITAILCEKLRRPPSDEFRIVALLPAKPYSGGDDTRGVLAELIEADGDRGRFLACTLAARSESLADPVYVHAKVGIVDDRWLTVGSANLNEHSLFNDTEMNVVTHDPDLARRTRLRLWAEHLELNESEVGEDPVSTIERHWKPISEEQLERRRAGKALTHRLVLLPHVSRRSARLLGPLQGLLVDG